MPKKARDRKNLQRTTAWWCKQPTETLLRHLHFGVTKKGEEAIRHALKQRGIDPKAL